MRQTDAIIKVNVFFTFDQFEDIMKTKNINQSNKIRRKFEQKNKIWTKNKKKRKEAN